MRAERTAGGVDSVAAALVAITVGAAGLRFATLDLQSFSADEAVTVGEIIRPGLAGTLEAVTETERAGPLYYVLAWTWSKLLGTGEVGIRSLSALAGTLTVPVAYAAAAELASRRAGLFAAALAAASPFLIWYSQEARAYGLFVLLSALSLLFLARAARRDSGRDLVGWAVASAAAMATHYFAVFLVAPEALYLLWRLRGRGAVAAVGAAGAAGAGLLPLALEQSARRPELAADTSLLVRTAETGAKFLGGGELLNVFPRPVDVHRVSLALACVAAALAIAGWALVAFRGESRERRGGLLAWALGATALAVPVALALAGRDLVNARNLIGALLPLLIAAAAGFGARRAGTLGIVAGAAMVAALLASAVIVFANPALQRRDFRAVAEAIDGSGVPRLVIAPERGTDPLAVYLPAYRELAAEPEEADEGGVQAGTVTVGEVVVVGPRRRTRPAPPAPGFRPVGRRRVGEYELRRYRAPAPRPVAVGKLEPDRAVAQESLLITNSERLGARRPSRSLLTGTPRPRSPRARRDDSRDAP